MNDLKTITACFTGHRNIPPEVLPMVQKRLKEILLECMEKGYRRFFAGGARGFDAIAARTVLELKQLYPDIKLVLALPCPNQTRGWKAEDIQEYEWIKSEADKVIYTSEHYFNGCMHKRNRFMVDNSNLCICYYIGQKGGTEYTVKYVVEKGLQIISVL